MVINQFNNVSSSVRNKPKPKPNKSCHKHVIIAEVYNHNRLSHFLKINIYKLNGFR